LIRLFGNSQITVELTLFNQITEALLTDMQSTSMRNRSDVRDQSFSEIIKPHLLFSHFWWNTRSNL